MIILLHKRNKREYPVTAEVLTKIQANPNWSDTYEIVQAPPKVPKEIKKLSGKLKPEFEEDGFTTSDATIPDGNVGEEQ